VLRAKILFSDALQKQVRVIEQVKVKRKQRFEDVSVGLARVTYYAMEARAGTRIRPPAGRQNGEPGNRLDGAVG